MLVHAAAVDFAMSSDPAVRRGLERMVDAIDRAQDADGYLNTYFQGSLAQRRYTEDRRSHELWCTAQLIQAGMGYYEATGERRLLDTAISAVAHLMRRFGPGKAALVDGHQGIGIGLASLYRLTGDREYLRFARYFLMNEGMDSFTFLPEWSFVPAWRDYELHYMFAEMPFSRRRELSGNGYRALYGAASAASYSLESGDSEMIPALDFDTVLVAGGGDEAAQAVGLPPSGGPDLVQRRALGASDHLQDLRTLARGARPGLQRGLPAGLGRFLRRFLPRRSRHQLRQRGMYASRGGQIEIIEKALLTHPLHFHSHARGQMADAAVVQVQAPFAVPLSRSRVDIRHDSHIDNCLPATRTRPKFAHAVTLRSIVFACPMRTTAHCRV